MVMLPRVWTLLNPWRKVMRWVDIVRMLLLLLASTFWELVLCILWAVVCDRRPDLMPRALRDDATIVGILGFFLTFSVSFVLSTMVSQHFSSIERYNAFCGQCYDFAVLVVNLHNGVRPDIKANSDGTTRRAITTIGMMPYAVKHVLRGTFRVGAFQRHPHWHSELAKAEFARRYTEANGDRNSDASLPFVILFEMIVADLEALKDQAAFSVQEWVTLSSRLETVWGPWGDMSTRNAYGMPRFIVAFLTATIWLYYVALIPYLVTQVGLSNGIWLTVVIVTIFSGCFDAAFEIRNPFVSARSHPFFFDPSETVTQSAKQTNAIIQRLFASAGLTETPLSIQWAGHQPRRRPIDQRA